ncbi:response regulator [Rufibacter sp. LB8]|uniref:response regulator n=1 Tax=Rufibacter sp. LB8 TaxID=2777781 RepID=UPI001CEF7FC7|nr:response regulator [Rufibacter sp. LB8]
MKSVLLIDDDPTALYVARNVLKRQNITEQIMTAQNGFEAISKLQAACSDPFYKEATPSLIIVDVKMPVMDGFQFVEAMQGLPLNPKPLVAMLTSSQNEYDIKRADMLGVDGYLGKPLTDEKLTEFLDACRERCLHD